jgi:cell division protein FtsQ
MQPKTRKALKRMGSAILWMVVLISFVVLVAAAARVKDAVRCQGIVVKISGSDDNFFIEEKDIKALVEKNPDLNPVGMPVSSINIGRLEKVVAQDPWVQQAELFLDNQHRLNIKVTQREPVARVFTTTGNSFYLDAEHERIPVSERYTARVPVFTGFPTDAVQLQKADSQLTASIVDISRFVLNDPFWMAQVEQVDISGDRKFEIIPKLGDHVIDFGEGTDVEKKFGKLMAFYKEGLSRVGWNNYTRINVAFENEVVCTRKDGTPPPKPTPPHIDSVDVDMAATGDTAVMIAPAREVVKPAARTVKPAEKPEPKKTVAKPAKKSNTQKAPAKPERQPKAVYKKPAGGSVNTTKKHRTP